MPCEVWVPKRLQRKGTQKTQNILWRGKERSKRDLEGRGTPLLACSLSAPGPSWHFVPSTFGMWGAFPSLRFPLGSLPHFPQCLLSSLPTEAFPDQARIITSGFLPSLQMPHPLLFLSPCHLSPSDIWYINTHLFMYCLCPTTRASALQMQDFGEFSSG